MNQVKKLPRFRGTPIAVLGNKCDAREACNEKQLREELGLSERKDETDRRVRLFMCSAKRNVGV